MNIFLPFPEDIEASVRSLDDRRLVKQIQEVKVLLSIAESHRTDGYAYHPVAIHYRTQPEFLHYYGFLCCREYLFRFDKTHAYNAIFKACDYNGTDYIPFYAEGSKDNPDCIRTTKNVGELFRAKLCRKWDNDKIPPRWTNRTAPGFYAARKNRNYY